MRLSSRTWSWISLLLLAGAVLCFYLEQRHRPSSVAPSPSPEAPTPSHTGNSAGPQARIPTFPLLSSQTAPTGSMSASSPAPGAALGPGTPVAAAPVTPPGGVPHRLANRTQSLETWMRSDTALLLENAFIDTATGTPPSVPEHLRATEDPGSYVLQYHGPLDGQFYHILHQAGAEFISYVPNNGALVRASAAVVSRLTADSRIRAAIPFEPYYKLSRTVLPLAVEDRNLPPKTRLNIVVFPGQRDAALAALDQLQVQVLGEGRTPFGPVLTVAPPQDALIALAQITAVQRIEVATRRATVNDLSRLRVGVTTNATILGTNTATPGALPGTNYLELTGKGVLVNINDTGVDASHPALTGRVSTTDTNSFTLLDYEGHGTHVAGTIAGDGTASETATNVFGSPTNANFMGLAPKADLYVLPIDLITGPLISDAFLQEKAAEEYYLRRKGTNALISNNSWAYPGVTEYDSSAATYDAAVRDALPDVTGPQPILYVFGAGNGGGGNEDGAGGEPDSILSPATAKNVVTVGAIEQLRVIDLAYYVTNAVPPGDTNPPTVITNYPYLARTDSDNEVAWFSSRGNTGMGTEGEYGRFKPDVVAPGEFLVSARSQHWDWQNLYPPSSPLYGVWSNLVAGCGPHYRYESGTSMSAPVVSGTLALLQEFFEQRLKQNFSPALLKALLINGSRSVHPRYSFQVRSILNYQGWGLIDMTNSLPQVIATNTDTATWPLRFFAHPQTNILATGQRHTWTLTLTNEARFVPLRATLVWTDPPGNPSVAKKLVNDLDLIVTNLDTGDVFYGNNIPRASDFTEADTTNSPASPDTVNNVENVFLAPPLGTNYSISVVGRRVNVNAVTDNITDVVQDYALVISAGEGQVTNPIVSLTAALPTAERIPASVLTNGIAQTQQRAGANFQLAPATNGVVDQWRFYIFTNTFFPEQNLAGITNGSNVAFLTFLPPNLSLPRNFDADIDLYVSTNAALTNLDAVALTEAFRSLKRGGSELIVLTNALTNQVFYVGVKAEDQQAAQFGLLVLSTDQPFYETDEFGNLVLNGMPAPAQIPDGSYDRPRGKEFTCIPPVTGLPTGILRTIAEIQLYHQNIGDLLGVLSQSGTSIGLLNGNRFNVGTNTYWQVRYDDSGSGLFFDSRPSDGPGSLNYFLGNSTAEPFWFALSDDALGNTGRVDRFQVRIKPNDLDEDGVYGTVLPNQWVYYYVDVPIGASLLTVLLSSLDPELPLDLYLRRDELPTFTEYDKYARIAPPGGQLSIGLRDVPPLNPGRYFIGIYNPNAVAVSFYLRYLIERDMNMVNRARILPDTPPEYIQDNAITYSTISVTESRPIVDLQVGLRVDHPRASDLVFHLLSPGGSRLLLAENRGGTSTGGYGVTLANTNVVSRTATGGPEEDRATLDVGANYGTLYLDYEFYVVPDTLRVYYDDVLIFDSGLTTGHHSTSVRFGPGVATNLVIVVNEGNAEVSNTRWTYTATLVNRRELYTVFTEQTNLATVPIKFAEAPFTNSPTMKVSTNELVFVDDFEDYAPATYPLNSTLGPWLVSLGQVVVHGDTNPLGLLASTGTNFLEFSPSTTPAAIRLALDTQLGGNYSTRLALRRNPNGPDPSPQTIGIYINGLLEQLITPPAGDWILQYVDWQAQRPTTTFEIRSESGVGPLLDGVEIYYLDPGDRAYFLPEEDLMEPLRGQSSLGDWTLEVWDNRAGPVALGTNAFRLVSWELNFIFANTNPPATLLTSCLLGTNTVSAYEDECTPAIQTVSGDETRYYIVEVPRTASIATNLVYSLTNVYNSSGDLVLLYSPDGLPDGTFASDVVVDSPNPFGEMLILDTNAPPLLQPGQRYYLGVRNADPTEVNAFIIAVSFDAVDPWLVATDVLTNGVAVTNTIPVTNALSFYQFAVSTNATHVLFEATPQTGDVNLVVRRARPVPDPLPRPQAGLHDYLSDNSGTQPEEIVVTGASMPVALEPGVWYLGVYNVAATPSTYTVRATEYTNLVTLTNGLSFAMTLNPTNGLQHFQYTASDLVTELHVRLDPSAGNPDLYVRQAVEGPYPLAKPQAGFFDYLSNTTNRDEIAIYPTSPVPVAAGVWFIGVQNTNTAAATFTLTALETTGSTAPIELTDGVPLTLALPITAPGSSFHFNIATPTPAVLFELFDLSGPASLFADLNQMPDSVLFLRQASGMPANPAQIVIRTNTYLPNLTGDWYLWVPAPTNTDLVFTICATTSSAGLLASGQPLAVTVTPPPTPDSGLAFRWNTVEGETYAVETSTDLVTWTEVWRQVATGTWLDYTDVAGTVNPLRFYRIRQIQP